MKPRRRNSLFLGWLIATAFVLAGAWWLCFGLGAYGFAVFGVLGWLVGSSIWADRRQSR